MRRVAGAALAGAVALGLRDTFRPRDPVAVVIDYAGDPPGLEPITLFFHPEVPEATLVLVR
jgi:hypothetical protein